MLFACDTIFRAQGITHWRWQQDGAGAHSTASTTTGDGTRAIIQAKAALIEPWPAHSPDLSPIEKCWYACEQHVWACETWTDLPSFKAAVQRAWAHVITPAYCRTLFGGIRNTYEVCRASGGREVKGWGKGAKPKPVPG